MRRVDHAYLIKQIRQVRQRVGQDVVTFRVSRRPREMHCGNARLCVCLSVCLSAAARPHYCTDPDVTWGNGRGCPQLCTIGRICNRCTGCVAMTTLWECVAEPSGNPPARPTARRTHAAHAHYACRRRLPSPAIKLTRLLRAPFHFVHTAGCCNANAKC